MCDLGPIRRVIMQPTTFCNIDCRYCYLPERDRRRWMSMDVVGATARLLRASNLVTDRVEVRWHAGEPLIAPIAFYDEACEILHDALGRDGRQVTFSLQTNGTLVNDAWCDLFERHDIRVGVSVDGPAAIHDAFRVTRRGLGTHARTMRGIEHLQRRGIPFEVISVVSRLTIAHQEDYVDFLERLRPASVGLNPEETEGDHASSLFAHDDAYRLYRGFLERMLSFQRSTGIPVRRLAAMERMVLSGALPARNDQVEPLMILSVDTDGNLGTYSPELLGWKAAEYGDFVFGNVLEPGCSLTEWPAGFRRLARAIAAGRDRCQAECQYFPVCGGGAAVNKWTENGSFASTRTRACECNVMAVADVVLGSLEAATATADATSGTAPGAVPDAHARSM